VELGGDHLIALIALKDVPVTTAIATVNLVFIASSSGTRPSEARTCNWRNKNRCFSFVFHCIYVYCFLIEIMCLSTFHHI
jgi:hypothetical protein